MWYDGHWWLRTGVALAQAILAQAISCSRSSLPVREVSLVCSLLRPGQPWCHATQGMVDDGCSRRLGSGSSWSQAIITEVARGSTTRSATPEPSAAFRTRPVQSCSTDTCASRRQPRGCSCENCQARESLGRDGRLPGVCYRGVEGGVGENQGRGQETPINVEVHGCRKFTRRSERRIHEMDAERAPEAVALSEAKDRLQRLEVGQAQQPDPNAHPAQSAPRDWQAEMEALKAQVAHLSRNATKLPESTHGRGTRVGRVATTPRLLPCRVSFQQSSTIECQTASRIFKTP